MAVVAITGQIADYDWGGPASISELFGWTPELNVEAEWWLGTHPLRPSHTADGELLTDWLGRKGEEAELPYLFKVLTPRKPLSLQVHPSPAQAHAGFLLEQQAGVPLDAPHRMFKDRFAKPELVVALGGAFHALAGLRPAADTIEALTGLVGDNPGPGVAAWLATLRGGDLQQTIAWLLRGDGDAALVPGELGQLAELDDTLNRLHRHYPGDPGIAVGFMMNRLTLLPGESAFLDAGQLHAYLEGNAIELMAPSDNVLRGGLTGKHVDVNALLDIASFEAGDPPRLEPRVLPAGGVLYQPPGYSFALGLIEGTEVDSTQAIHSPTLVVCTSGVWQVRAGGEERELSPGDAAMVTGEPQMRLAGSGQLWWATAD